MNYKTKLKQSSQIFTLYRVKNWVIIIISLLLVTISCVQNTKNREIEGRIELRKKAVLDMHDSLMVKMSELRNVEKRIEGFSMDSVRNDEFFQRSTIVIQQLKQADKAMWDWMHEFDISYKDLEDSLTLEYFDRKYETILVVDSLFKNAIFEGTNFINYVHAQ